MPKDFLTDAEVAALEGQQGGPPEFIPDEALAPAQAGVVGGGAPRAGRVLEPMTGGQSIIRGGLAGASRNFGDEISAGIGAGLYGAAKGVRSILPGGVPEGAPSVGDVYRSIREGERDKYASAFAAHPVLYTAAGIAGAAANTPGAPGIASLRGAQRIAALAKAGAISGGLAGAGASEGGFGQTLAEGARGAAIGALAAPAGDALVRGAAVPVAATARGLGRAAGFALSRVAGGIQRDVAPAGGAAAFARAGLEGKAAGLIKPWDFLPGAMARQEARVAEFARQSTDDIVKAIDDSGAKVAVAPLQQVLRDASAELRQFSSANRAPLKVVDGLIKDLGRNADGAGHVSARTLQTAKKTIDNLIKTWDPFGKSSLAQDLNKALYRGVMEAQEEAVAAAPDGAGQAAYQVAKRASSLAQRLENFQASYAARQANQLAGVGGLHGAIGGVAGLASAFATGDPVRGLATYGATRFATSPRTHALALLGAERAAQALPAFARSPFLPPVAVGAAQSLIDSLEEQPQRRRLNAR